MIKDKVQKRNASRAACERFVETCVRSNTSDLIEEIRNEADEKIQNLEDRMTGLRRALRNRVGPEWPCAPESLTPPKIQREPQQG